MIAADIHICYDAISLQWRHDGRDSVLNHQPPDCLLNSSFRRRSKKTPKLRVIGLCVGNSPETDGFPAQMASNAENVCIWWRHHVIAQNQHTKTTISIAFNCQGGGLVKWTDDKLCHQVKLYKTQTYRLNNIPKKFIDAIYQ